MWWEWTCEDTEGPAFLYLTPLGIPLSAGCFSDASEMFIGRHGRTGPLLMALIDAGIMEAWRSTFTNSIPRPPLGSNDKSSSSPVPQE
jgi:hypothetical protein